METQPSEILWLGPHHAKWFKLTVTNKLTVTDTKTHSVSATVEEVVAWDEDGSPLEFQPYLKCAMKWDGCSHLWFGDEGYLHICGAECFEKHLFLIKELYRWAEKSIPMEKQISGEFNP